MEHPYLFGFSVVVILGLTLRAWLRRNHAKVKREDYLVVLSHNSWKRGRQIKEEMESLYRGWLSWGEVYWALAKLEDEGWVEIRIFVEYSHALGKEREVAEFKLSSDGTRYKEELRSPHPCPPVTPLPKLV